VIAAGSPRPAKRAVLAIMDALRSERILAEARQFDAAIKVGSSPGSAFEPRPGVAQAA